MMSQKVQVRKSIFIITLLRARLSTQSISFALSTFTSIRTLIRFSPPGIHLFSGIMDLSISVLTLKLDLEKFLKLGIFQSSIFFGAFVKLFNIKKRRWLLICTGQVF